MTTSALILVDIQNDFLPGGALAVPRGDEVVSVANRLIPHFDLVIATQDWHPADHLSFADNHPGLRIGDRITVAGIEQILWPVHCVQDSSGAEFASALELPTDAKVFHKGGDPEVDSYSGFFDNGRRHATGLADSLRSLGVNDLVVMGLATDYCVKFTVLDACDLGFRVEVIEDGVRAVNLQPGDDEEALNECEQAGAVRVRSADILGRS